MYHAHGSSASSRSLLRRLHLSLSLSLSLSLGPQPLPWGPKRSTFVDYGGRPWQEQRRGRTKGSKKKREKEGGICFEKKGASQTGKAPMLPSPKMTPRGGLTTRQTLSPTPSSGVWQHGHLGSTWKGGGGEESKSWGTRSDCPTLPRYIDRDRPVSVPLFTPVVDGGLPPRCSCTSGGARI
ncbi:hypothetical protein LY76DRAFT_305411 [Colletotrichum caudatum]|nr:hypothetical protein LY76DRAFT_305411 [Colletotrichum caudatum]